MSDVTHILSQIEQGEPQAAAQLLPLVYEELRKLAAVKLAQERPGQTLQPTALVHEAYLRLVEKPDDGEQRTQAIETSRAGMPPGSSHFSPMLWNSRGHFFAAAAEAMRRILVENARHKNTHKASGGLRRVELSGVDPAIPDSGFDLLGLNEALDRLEAKDPRKAQLVKLRFFAGLTIEQAAKALDIATSTADADWAYAKCWLRAEMAGLDRAKS
jgi:hypothetical protein